MTVMIQHVVHYTPGPALQHTPVLDAESLLVLPEVSAPCCSLLRLTAEYVE
jgi:hypothetical protein